MSAEDRLSKKQVNEMFGDAELRFTSYYKYSFSFHGDYGGYSIVTGMGGSGDDIYRLEVDNEPTPFSSVDKWNFVNVSKDDKTVFEHVDY